MGGLKIIGFFETESTFCAHWATWRAEVRKPKKTFMMSRRLWVFRGSMSFQWWRSCAFGFPRGCPPINSILCTLLHFPYCVFSESTTSSSFCVLLCFLEWSPRIFWRWFVAFWRCLPCDLQPLPSFLHLVRIFCALLFCFLRFGVVGLLLVCLGECHCDWVFCQLFVRVWLCLRVSVAPLCFLWVGGFSLG